jgi:hypothetical protein
MRGGAVGHAHLEARPVVVPGEIRRPVEFSHNGSTRQSVKSVTLERVGNHRHRITHSLMHAA